MKLRTTLYGTIGLMLGFFILAAPAYAQATRTWVSGVGDDANPCSRTAPCKTFAGAISKTAAGGEINCIDPGGFGAVTIVKAMTIDCANVEAGVVVAGTNGVIVNAGATDVVVLRGIDFMGTITVPGLNGVSFLAGGALHVEKCLIREFTSAAPNGNGILFQPSGASKLFVTNTTITNNVGSGIKIRPTGTGSASATVVSSNTFNNGVGVTVDTSAPTSGFAVAILNEVTASGNATGFSSVSSAASGVATIVLDRALAALNTTGLSASGAQATVIAGGSTVQGNATALSAASGGQLLTFGNNLVTGAGGFTSPPIGFK